MKKLVSVALVLILCLSLGTTAFAAPITDVDTDSTNDVGVGGVNTDTHNVTGTATVTTAIVYSVDVTWGAMTFTYTDTETWDPNTLAYDNDYGTWTATTPGVTDIVTVANKSNAPVVATFETDVITTETLASIGTTSPGLENKVGSLKNNASFEALAPAGTLNLPSAVGAGTGGNNAAPEGAFTVHVSGAPTADIVNETIATLTITITAGTFA